MTSQSEVGYSCEKQQTYRVLFDKPILAHADHWYVVCASVSSPSGISSDAGSSGQSEVTGQDRSAVAERVCDYFLSVSLIYKCDHLAPGQILHLGKPRT